MCMAFTGTIKEMEFIVGKFEKPAAEFRGKIRTS